MPRSRDRLTASVQAQICACIRAGAFTHVAAEAAGVSTEEYEEWMELGAARKGKKPRKKFANFRAAVKQAVAQARLSAEMKAYQEDPLA